MLLSGASRCSGVCWLPPARPRTSVRCTWASAGWPRVRSTWSAARLRVSVDRGLTSVTCWHRCHTQQCQRCNLPCCPRLCLSPGRVCHTSLRCSCLAAAWRQLWLAPLRTGAKLPAHLRLSGSLLTLGLHHLCVSSASCGLSSLRHPALVLRAGSGSCTRGGGGAGSQGWPRGGGSSDSRRGGGHGYQQQMEQGQIFGSGGQLVAVLWRRQCLAVAARCCDLYWVQLLGRQHSSGASGRQLLSVTCGGRALLLL